jgi:hypothetical protein
MPCISTRSPHAQPSALLLRVLTPYVAPSDCAALLATYATGRCASTLPCSSSSAPESDAARMVRLQLRVSGLHHTYSAAQCCGIYPA